MKKQEVLVVQDLKHNIEIRLAQTEAERHAAYRLRYDLYVRDQGLFHDEADHQRGWLCDTDDQHGRILLALENERLVGTLRVCLGKDHPLSEKNRELFQCALFDGILEDKDLLIASRFLVLPEYRSGLLAFKLQWELLELAVREGVELILANCDVHLLNRYFSLGWQPYGKMINDENGIRLLIGFLVSDPEHLANIRSPLIQILRHQPGPKRDVLRTTLGQTNQLLSAERAQSDEYAQLIKKWMQEVCPIFQDLLDTPEDAMALLAKSHVLTCEPHHYLIMKGHTSRTLYILLEGTLIVCDEGRQLAEVKRKGSLLGEVAFFTRGPRICEVRVGEEGARVLALNSSKLEQLINQYGTLSARFLHFVAKEMCLKLSERAQPPNAP